MRHKAVTTTATALVGTCLVAAWAASSVARADTGTGTPAGVAAPLRGGSTSVDNLPGGNASADALRAAEAGLLLGVGEGPAVWVVAPQMDAPTMDELGLVSDSEAPSGGTYVVPEPGSALLFLSGVAVALRVRQRRRD